MPRKTGYFWLAALLSGWAVDFLFWGKTPGISVLLWVGWVLALGLTLGYVEGIRPSKVNFLVIALAILAGAVPFLRREPFTLFVACLLAFCLLCLLAFSFRNGTWIFYRIWDFLVATLRLIGEWFTGGLRLKRSPVAESEGGKPAGKKGANTVLLVMLGILLALPILGIFGALLSAADPIFGARLADFLAIFNIENLPEYLFRLAYILVVTYFIAGSFVHAFYNRHDEKPDPARSGFKPFMSWIPAAVILFLVDLLFVSFVVVQFTYFFGAHSNITAEGYTYAEYARRGFFELVSVAVISLILVFGLGAITQRKTRSQQSILAALNLVLICMVLVMLLSSWQRLNLYEEAYGYSRLRAYTTVFIPWLGALLIAAGVLDVLGKMRWFGLSLVIVTVGFAFSQPILNIDRFIAGRNIDRAVSGEEFDAAYLATLSSDAVPTMFEGYYDADLDPVDQAKLGASLACMSQRLMQAPEQPWQSYNLPDATARALFIKNREMLEKYPLTLKDGIWQVDAGEYPFYCNSVYMD